jgi:hypothetical protein
MTRLPLGFESAEGAEPRDKQSSRALCESATPTFKSWRPENLLLSASFCELALQRKAAFPQSVARRFQSSTVRCAGGRRPGLLRHGRLLRGASAASRGDHGFGTPGRRVPRVNRLEGTSHGADSGRFLLDLNRRGRFTLRCSCSGGRNGMVAPPVAKSRLRLARTCTSPRYLP